MTAEDARRLLGATALIGISIKSTAAAEAAPVEIIDYVGSGGVYATLSKQQKNAPIGPEGLGHIAAVLHRRAPRLPIAGIAGIDAGNAAAVIAAGAGGVAVISAISLAPDPAAAARALRDIVDTALAKRGA
jgi:thiamine-phosphate pyrophosphorylase